MPNDLTTKSKLNHSQACFSIIKNGSKSFHFASLILPRDMRMAAASLYAFCRVSDDIIDDPRATLSAVHRLKDRIDAAYAGRPNNHIADRAFAEVVRVYNIPKSVPLSMIEGFEWDLNGKAIPEYRTGHRLFSEGRWNGWHHDELSHAAPFSKDAGSGV